MHEEVVNTYLITPREKAHGTYKQKHIPCGIRILIILMYIVFTYLSNISHLSGLKQRGTLDQFAENIQSGLAKFECPDRAAAMSKHILHKVSKSNLAIEKGTMSETEDKYEK